MRKEYLEAGRIVGTHGVRGELRMESTAPKETPLIIDGIRR